jgi:hypothetical protein
MSASGVRTIEVDGRNRFLRVSGDFLFCGTCLVRYLGDEGNVTICGDVESVSTGCFSLGRSLMSVGFDSDCKISTLAAFAFEWCSLLQSVWIPCSIETISRGCFAACQNLSNVKFESGSKIRNLGDDAFQWCFSLRSVCIPSSIEVISASCFSSCAQPFRLVLDPGCHLSDDCLSALRSIRKMTLEWSMPLPATTAP